MVREMGFCGKKCRIGRGAADNAVKNAKNAENPIRALIELYNREVLSRIEVSRILSADILVKP